MPRSPELQFSVSLHGFGLNTEFEAFIGNHYIMCQYFLGACGDDVRRNVEGAIFSALNSSGDACYIGATELPNHDIQFNVLASCGTRTDHSVGLVILQISRSGLVVADQRDLYDVERVKPATQLAATQLASVLPVSRIIIYKLAKRGRIPSFRVGTYVRFDPRAVANWLRSQ